jgi:CubicO group peptidase (beta-lactamase class C family)
VRNKAFKSAMVSGLSLVIMIAGCAGDFVENGAGGASNENAKAPAGAGDVNETEDGVQGVVAQAAFAQTLTAAPASSDDDTLSPRGAAARHGTHESKTFEQLVQRWRQHYEAGMRLIDLDVYEDSDGTPRFYGTWAPGTGGSALYRYTSEAAFMQRVETQRQLNSQLVDMEIVKIGSTTWYYGVWVGSGNNDPVTKSTSWAAFQTLHAQRAAQGQRLVDIEIALENDQPRYWGVWEVGTTPTQHLIRGTSLSAFGDAHTQARADGQRLRHLSGVHKADQSQEYVGVTDEASGGWAYYVYTSWASFKSQWAEQAEAGRSLRDLEVIDRPGGGRYYIGTWGSGPADPANRTDTAAMATQIQSALSGNVAGFSYGIADQSQLAIAGAGGLAQRAPNPVHAMTSRTPSTVASVTKHFTGVAMLALLERNGLEPTEEILGHLPAAWDAAASFNDLTFEHLLTHTSGFNQLLTTTAVEGAGNDWDGLQVMVEQIGAQPGASRQYKNANFALQRVLIPALRRELEGASIPVVTEGNSRELYLQALDSIAFERLGIEDISCEPAAGQIEALSYNFGDATVAGRSWATTSSGCGGHAGLQFNAQQLAEFLTGVRYSDHILSASSKAYMDANRAGWSSATPVEGGTAYSHGGDYFGGSGRETHTCVMRLPNGIDASLIINSDTPTSPCSVLVTAYNAATP